MVSSAHPAASRSFFINEQPQTRLWPEVAMDHRGHEDTWQSEEASVSHVMKYLSRNSYGCLFRFT